MTRGLVSSLALFAACFLLAQEKSKVLDEPLPAPTEFVCPMDPDIRSKVPGKCSKCGMKLEPGIKDQVAYPVTLKITPGNTPAGRPLDLDFTVSDPTSGQPVQEFEIVHEKLFHLFVLSQDLQHFQHVHPDPLPGGSFRLRTTFPQPGIYRLLTDFYPTGGTPQLIPLTVTTAGYSGPLKPAELARDLSPKRGENMQVSLEMEPPQPIAGAKTMLFFRIQPGDGLEPLLGAWGHLLAASNDLIDTMHAHPAIAGGGPQVQFNLFFPREATYRIWVQFQRQGQISTVQFTVPVSRLK